MTQQTPMTWRSDGNTVFVSGVFNERSDFDGLFMALSAGAVLDLSGVTLINSMGVRGWMRFAARIRDEQKPLVLRAASVAFVGQATMIANFLAGLPLESFLARFACESCGAYSDVTVVNERASQAILQSTRRCECGEEQEFDDFVEPYSALLGASST
jgi:hypothetical protein